MHKTKRKICVVTGTRAEYGLLYWLIKEIKEDPELELKLAVTGAHLSKKHGLTYKEITNDGFLIDEKIEVDLNDDTELGISRAIAQGINGFANVWNKIKPDIIVVLGDRFEILAAVVASMIAKIPVAHIHGGETSEGVIDEAIRHSITKMSHFHFVAAKEYESRVIQLGEKPSTVFNFGAPGIENIKRLKLFQRHELEKELGIKFGKTNFLVTYHPVTLQNDSTSNGMTELLKALDEFNNAYIIFTKPNTDTGGKIISEMIDNYCLNNPGRAYAFTSLGRLKYLSTVKFSNIIIGNSSSGIIEAPFFKKPTINIGLRQRGRLKAKSIIDCDEDASAITEAIKHGVSDDFTAVLETSKSLYGDGNTAVNIKNTLKVVNLENVLIKRFNDL